MESHVSDDPQPDGRAQGTSPHEPHPRGDAMTIDADLIGRQAREFQELEVAPARAGELAQELRALVDNALRAAQDAQFDDEPDRFLYLLSALRDPPLG
jgi:hypothetical protein